MGKLKLVVLMWIFQRRIFSIDVYALLEPGATLFFISPLIARKFDNLPDILNEPFMVTTLVGESVVANRVYIS